MSLTATRFKAGSSWNAHKHPSETPSHGLTLPHCPHFNGYQGLYGWPQAAAGIPSLAFHLARGERTHAHLRRVHGRTEGKGDTTQRCVFYLSSTFHLLSILPVCPQPNVKALCHRCLQSMRPSGQRVPLTKNPLFSDHEIPLLSHLPSIIAKGCLPVPLRHPQDNRAPSA